MKHLFVLFDDSCEFCRRCAQWLSAQPQRVPMYCLALSSREAQSLLADDQRLKGELQVIDSDGGIYNGSDAFILALWALSDYSEWAVRLSKGALKPLSRAFFEWLSSRRTTFSKWLSDDDVVRILTPLKAPGCDDGRCDVPAREVAVKRCRGCNQSCPDSGSYCARCWADIWRQTGA